MTVDYFDGSIDGSIDGEVGEFSLDYDSTDGALPSNGAYKRTTAIRLTGSNTWRTATFDLPDAYSGDRQNSGADLHVAIQDIDLAVARVTVEKVQAPCPHRLYLPLVADSPSFPPAKTHFSSLRLCVNSAP